MPSWYEIKAKSNESDTLEMSIHAEIGAWGITGKQFAKDFADKRGNAKNLTLSICSPGGSVFDGWLIFNTLKNSGMTITTKNMGIAASMASVLMMLGDKREAPANTMMMVHNAISGIYGDAEDMRDVANTLDKIDNAIVATYAARSGKDEKTVRDLMNKDTFMTAAEALDLGFLDTVTDPIEAKAQFATDMLPANVQALFTAKNSTTTPPAKPTQTTPDKAFADQVKAMAEVAGLGEYAAHFALSTESIEGAAGRIRRAGEIKALCALTKRDGDAVAFIRDDKPIGEVRAHLLAALAKHDEDTYIDNTLNNADTKPQADGKKGIDVRAVYAKRNTRGKQQKASA